MESTKIRETEKVYYAILLRAKSCWSTERSIEKSRISDPEGGDSERGLQIDLEYIKSRFYDSSFRYQIAICSLQTHSKQSTNS